MEEKKINVLEFTGSMNDGGAETLVKDYALLLNKKNFCVKIATIYDRNDTANSRRIKNENICLIPIFKKRNLVTRVIKEFFGWYVSYKLYSIIKKNDIEVLHVHLALLKYLLPIRKKIKNVKLFYTCHNLPEKMFQGKRKKEGDAARLLIDSNQLRLIALHDEMRDEINNMFGISNCIVVKNGINFACFENVKSSKKIIRENLGLPVDAFVIGHVGRFSEQKNHSFLIDVFKKVVEKKKNSYLLLVGSGETKEIIEKKIDENNLKNNVLVLSNRTDIPELMKSMDVFVFPSFFEGLSITLIEAQASGKKCVVSDSINPENFMTKKTIPLSLKEKSDLWAKVILDDTVCHDPKSDLQEYNLINGLRLLEKLYLM